MVIRHELEYVAPSVTHNVLQGSRAAEGEILELGQEFAGLLRFLLELIRAVDLLDVLLECLRVPISMTRLFDFRLEASTHGTVGPALQRKVVCGLNGLD